MNGRWVPANSLVVGMEARPMSDEAFSDTSLASRHSRMPISNPAMTRRKRGRDLALLVIQSNPTRSLSSWASLGLHPDASEKVLAAYDLPGAGSRWNSLVLSSDRTTLMGIRDHDDFDRNDLLTTVVVVFAGLMTVALTAFALFWIW
jgi:hypothetical protein